MPPGGTPPGGIPIPGGGIGIPPGGGGNCEEERVRPDRWGTRGAELTGMPRPWGPPGYIGGAGAPRPIGIPAEQGNQLPRL